MLLEKKCTTVSCIKLYTGVRNVDRSLSSIIHMLRSRGFRMGLVFTLVWIICGLIVLNLLTLHHHKNYRKELELRSYFDGRRLCTYTEELSELNEKHDKTSKVLLKGLIIVMVTVPLLLSDVL